MTELLPAPLDPEGMVWEHFGRQPVFRLSNGLREAMLQNMHPGLAAGVEHHSVFFEDPRARGERSIGPIMSVVYGGPTSHEWGEVSTAPSKASTNTVVDTARLTRRPSSGRTQRSSKTS